MIPRINILKTLASRLRKLIEPDSKEAEVYQYLKKTRLPALPAKDVVLVQCVESLYYFGLFGQIVSSLRETQSVRVEQYMLRSLRVGEAKSLFVFMASRLFINPLHSFKWIRLYRSFCDGVGYRITLFRPIADVVDVYRAWICWRSLTDKESLLGMMMDEITVGDLINDSFLRFKPAPMVDLKDTYLLILLWQAYRDVRRAKAYFTRVRPKLYLTSYSTYIQHGIPVRVALQYGVRVFSFGNYQEFTKELTLKDWVHTKNPDGYAKEFSTLDHQDEKLALAEAALSARLSGRLDSATAYMKKSAYVESDEPVPDVRGAIVIFLHDFFDSPHGYRHMLFPDFWEWICFTIETLEKSNICFFVKPHPNQIDLSDHELSKLKNLYPNMKMISPNITNKQLAQAGMACAVTVYGTVAHEMAYLGVPTIGCGDNPHVSFNFCTTTRSKSEYADALCRYAEIKFDKAAMHRQSLIFYFMHNLSSSDEERVLLREILKWHQLCENATHDKEELIVSLTRISELPGFNVCISKLLDALNRKMT